METKTPSPIVGIDLGTTLSAVGLFADGAPKLIENPLGEVLTPSVVARDPRTAGLVVGRVAKDLLAHKPHLAAAYFKRDMGGDRTCEVDKESMTPVELSACVLDALRADAERELGCGVNRCVVTVPAYFNEAQRFATKRAAEIAGFMVERVLNEPTAAAIAHGLHRGEDESTFLVFDLGGGTFDVCVMELFEGMLEVKSVAGESRLGGEDFTRALARLVLERVGRDPDEAERDADFWAGLYKRAELLKRQLSSWQQGTITLPGDDGTTLSVTAGEAKAAWGRLLDRMVGPCRAALRGAGITAADLNEVILVGGATRTPCVQELAREIFGRQPLISDDPDLLVVRGATVQAALCADDEAVSDMVVTDVASHSLGVETSRRLGGHYNSGYFAPVIHRNTVIPISRHEEFYTIARNQRQMEISVFEGEARRIEQNRYIGSFMVKDLPPASAGDVAVRVTFTLDLDGILEVEAEVRATGKKVSRLFNRKDGGSLRGVKLAKVRERIRALKTDPALRPRYRDLLGRAELLWRELSGDERHTLDAAIQEFEGALKNRIPDEITRCYQLLEQICSALDQGERW